MDRWCPQLRRSAVSTYCEWKEPNKELNDNVKTHLFVKHIHFFKRSAERRQNDNITFSNGIKILLSSFKFFNKLDIHVRQVVVNFWVVNEFISDVNSFAWKVRNGFVGQSNGPFDTPAESKVL